MEKEQQIALILSAQKGDSDAINTLFSEVYNDIYYFALKTVKDSELACDITQEALIDIFNNITSLQDPVAFPAWSRQITYRQCTRHFRKKTDVLLDENEDGGSIFDTIEEENVEFIPDQLLDQKDFRKTVMNFIDTLSEEQRSAVLLYYFEERSIGEIAQIQNVSEGTVKSRLNYARKTIKALVEDYEQKNNIKLHALPFFPFIRWIFGPDKAANLLPAATVQSAASAVGASVGSSAAAATTTTATAATAATSTATATAATAATVTAAKVVGIPLVAKIVAGIVATAIVAGGAFVVTNNITENNRDDDDDEKRPMIAVQDEGVDSSNIEVFEDVEMSKDSKVVYGNILFNLIHSYSSDGEYQESFFNAVAVETDNSSGPLDLEIPNAIDGIPVTVRNFRFNEYEINSLEINTTEIEAGLFNGTSIKHLIIGRDVEVISNHAFANCKDLTNIYFHKREKPLAIITSAFMNCPFLDNLPMEDGMLIIDGVLFKAIPNEEVTIPEGVVAVYEEAFELGLVDYYTDPVTGELSSERYSVSNQFLIKKLHLPSTLKKISGRAVSFAPEEITISPQNTTYHVNGNCLIETESKTLVAGSTSSIIPSDGSVTIIGYEAFDYFSNETPIHLSLPDCIEEIQSEAFTMSSFIINKLPNNLRSVGMAAFAVGIFGVEFEDTTIPPNLTEVNDSAFADSNIKYP